MSGIPIFVGPDLSVLRGDRALEALRQENDAKYLSPADGIVSVPLARWRIAQAAERRHWMLGGLDLAQDRNEEHFHGFGRYEALRGKRIHRAIELGCGPFTNLRWIASRCDIGGATLLDPLLEEYLQHPFCSYADGRELRVLPWFLLRPVWRWATDLQRRVRHVHLRGELRAGSGGTRSRRHRFVRAALDALAALHLRRPDRRLPVCHLLAVPIEEMPIDPDYDLVVLINVIEHCYDVRRIFEKLLAITKPGAVLVFHDRYYRPADVEQDATMLYDVAHPLRIARHLIDDFLARNFEPIFRTEYRSEVDTGRRQEMLYFIGTRRRVGASARTAGKPPDAPHG